jgi:hypothetical protein
LKPHHSPPVQLAVTTSLSKSLSPPICKIFTVIPETNHQVVTSSDITDFKKRGPVQGKENVL